MALLEQRAFRAAGARSAPALLLAVLGLGASTFVFGAAPSPQARVQRPPSLRAAGEVAGTAVLEQEKEATMLDAASEADSAAAEAAFLEWQDQFPMVAARRNFYSGSDASGNPVNIDCSPEAVRERFLVLAESLGTSPEEALDIFKKNMFIMNEATEAIPVKVQALREVAESDEDMMDLLRQSPKAFGMTSTAEILERGMSEMRTRANIDAFYDVISTPIKGTADWFRRQSAEQILAAKEEDREGEVEAANEAEANTRKNIGIFFFSSWIGALLYVSYLDVTIGGPIHGKGICAASPIPTFNIPDAEGNTRLPFNCAPIYKWYLEPQMTTEQKDFMQKFQVKVESKNCGREFGGEKKACDPTTVGGRVWTAEELEKDPTFWEKK